MSCVVADVVEADGVNGSADSGGVGHLPLLVAERGLGELGLQRAAYGGQQDAGTEEDVGAALEETSVKRRAMRPFPVAV